MFLIYTRKSTDDADNQKNSLDHQRRVCREFAGQRDLQVTEDTVSGIMEKGVIAESHSAFTASALTVSGAGLVEYQIERPKFMQMISWLLEGKYEGVIVLCWDRISRNEQSDLIVKELIKKHGIRVIFVQAEYDVGTSSGELHMDIDGMFARHHSRVTSEKVRNTFKKLRADRQFPHRAPIGYLDLGPDKKVLDPERAPIMKRMFELYATGEWSISALEEWALKQGLTPKPRKRKRTRDEIMNGKEITEQIIKFGKAGIQNALRNPFYVGSMFIKGELLEGSHPALVDMATFEKVQDMLTRNNRTVRYAHLPFYSMRSFLKCTCGRRHVPYRAKKNEEVYYQIKCLPECKNKVRNFHEDRAIDEAITVIDQIHFTDEQLAEIEAGMKSGLQRAHKRRDSELADIQRERMQITKDLDYLQENKIRLLHDRAMTPAEWKADADRLTAKLREFDALQAAYTETEEEMVEYVLNFSELMKRASSIFKLANDIERRKIVHMVFTELTLFDGKLVAYKATEGMELFLKRPVGVNGGRPQT